MQKWLLAALAALAFGQAGAAVVLDGVGVSDEDFAAWYDAQPAVQVAEDGFLYYQSTTYPSGIIALHDDEGLLGSEIRRADGQPFTLTSLSFEAWNLAYTSAADPRPDEAADPEDIDAWARAKPFDGAKVVFVGQTSTGPAGMIEVPFLTYLSQTVDFGPAFSNIEALEILFYQAGFAHLYDTDGLQPGDAWCDGYCGQVTINSATISAPAPVPLPAGAPLLAAALGLMAAGRRRARP